MHSVSELWRQIFDEPNHRKEVMVKVNGVEYHEDRVLYPAPSVVGKLFDAPSVGNARARTLTLNLMPYDGPSGRIPPMSEIRLFVRLKSADGQSTSEWIQKGVFYADEVKREGVTGATRITAFDAMMKMELQFGISISDGQGGVTTRTCAVSFHDGFGGIQKFHPHIGDPMPTPTTPTHTGERFAAWYPNPADTQTVVRDMLFMAHWLKKFTVTFDSGSGTPQTFVCFSGDATPTPTTPTKEGYAFTGWSPTPAATVTADATYTAQWEWIRYVIASYPAKSDYFVGDALDYTGLVVEERFADGTAPRNITADCELLPAEDTPVTEPGDIMVDVRHDGKSLGAFWVAVFKVEITTYPAKLDYVIGDTLDYTGLVITETLPDGTTRDITADCIFTPTEGTEITETGTIPVTVSYNGETVATFEIEAVGVIASGDCWTLYDNGLLDIYCIGAIPDYLTTSNPVRSPWVEYAWGKISIIKTATIRDSVTSIGTCAFQDCEYLTSVTIPDSVTSIGYDAFYNCRRLANVTIPDSVISIRNGAFYGCSALTEVTIPSGVTSIGVWAFRASGLTSITIPNSVTSIGGGVYPPSGSNIGGGAFFNCDHLTSINVDSGNGNYSSENGVLFNKTKTALYEYPIGKTETAYVIPDSVTTIAAGAFENCKNLTSVTIGDSVVSIRESAFYNCSALTEVSIPLSVRYIYNIAFHFCSSLTDVYYSGTQTQWGRITIKSNNTPLTSATIHYNSSGPS